MQKIKEILEEWYQIKADPSVLSLIEKEIKEMMLSEEETHQVLLKIYRQGAFPSLGRLRAFNKAVHLAQEKKINRKDASK